MCEKLKLDQDYTNVNRKLIISFAFKIQCTVFHVHVAGYQTVGEEYVNIIMVDGSRRSLPSKLV